MGLKAGNTMTKERTVYENRELSWIKFNERVLEEAEDEANPLMERLKFLSIFMSNFDEFYRVRVGMLSDDLLIDGSKTDRTIGMTVPEQLTAIYKATHKLFPRFDVAYAGVMEGLEAYGLFQIKPGKAIPNKDKAFLKRLFEHDIAPLLSPFIIEKKHPFPFLENGQAVVGVTLQTKNGNVRFGLLPITSSLPKLIFLPGEETRFILIEDLVFLFADNIFHKFTVLEKAAFSIIRNADVSEHEGLYDYDVDLRATMSKLLERRYILAPVAIKYAGANCKKLLAHLGAALYIKKRQTFETHAPLDMRFFAELERALPQSRTSELYYPTVSPHKCCDVDEGQNIIDQILKRDILITYPFEDVSALVSFIRQAAEDGRVRAISMTLYRVARRSQIVAALIDAVKKGKDVTCVVELRARFDEENNIDWAGRLQDAGCRVLYGPPLHKVHAKLFLIELEEAGKRKRVCLIGTGNFNEVTAHVYTDISLLTAHKGICDDVEKVFDSLKEGHFIEDTGHLLVAPLCLKTKLMELIDGEIEKKRAGRPSSITLKLNSLTEKELMDKLLEASQAGVRVRLIVRGMCCLTPGIPGLTDHIEVRSIVGRYLEHSRIYAFGTGAARRYFISSADWMTRNTTQRIEVAAPVYDRRCKARLSRILRLSFADNVKARVMGPDGKYHKRVSRRAKIDSQAEMFSIDN